MSSGARARRWRARRPAICAAALLAVACGGADDDARSTETTARERPPPAAPPAAIPATPPAQPSSPAEAPHPADAPPTPEPASDASADRALASYRALNEAFARGDRTAYLGRYADRLRCFFGRRDPATDVVARARDEALAANARGEPRAVVRSIETRVLRASADEVELADFGWTGPGASIATTFHQKRVVLAREGDAWRVVVETSLSDRACGLPPVAARPPPLWVFMRDGHAALIEGCEGPPGSTLEDGYPGIGGSIGCDARSAMQGAEELCLELPDAERDDCFDRARAEIDAYAGD